jgi:hypothetical protein
MSYSVVVNWQRTNIQTAATYLRERIAAGTTDFRTKAVYEGLLDVLEPTRRTVRMQRELAEAAKGAAAAQVARPTRSRMERRQRRDRRVASLEPPGGVDRRRVPDRRAGRDRRGGRE